MSKRGKVLIGLGGAVLLVGLIVMSASAKRERGVEVRFEKVGRRDLVVVEPVERVFPSVRDPLRGGSGH